MTMSAPRQVVSFRLGDLLCAVPLEQVQEVVAMPAITPLPNVSEHLLGVVDLHGTPCPVLDLRRALDVPPSPVSPEQHLLILRSHHLLAAPADRVEGVMSASVAAVPAPSRNPLISGIITGPQGSLLVLDLERSLDEPPEAAA